MEIITGYRGEAHITSAQDRKINQGAFGSGSYILDVGRVLEAEIVTANEIRVYDGALVLQGCAADIQTGTYDALEIASGTQGMNRSDLICARYTKDAGTNVENMALVVITGTPTAGEPTTPAYNTGNIADGDSPVDFPLYQVNISGVAINSVIRLASVVENISTLSTLFPIAEARSVSGSLTYSSTSGFSTASVDLGEPTDGVFRFFNGAFFTNGAVSIPGAISNNRYARAAIDGNRQGQSVTISYIELTLF